MDSLDSVLDPSDWLTTRLPPLYELDSMIRCHICKEFMSSPVLTGCGHSFCSLCIRSTLSTLGKCPLCNEEQIESKLRKNLILEEIIVFYKRYRADMIQMLAVEKDVIAEEKEIENENGAAHEWISLDSEDEDNNSVVGKRSSSPVSVGQMKTKQRKTVSVTDQISRSKKTIENLSECPICHNFFPLEEIQTTHIDTCLRNNNDTEVTEIEEKNEVMLTTTTTTAGENKRPAKKTVLSNFFVRKPEKQPTKTFNFDKNKQYQIQHLSGNNNNNSNNSKPLKKLNFSSLTTTKLKEKLSLLSLPTTGSRQQLETRYNQYVILYNSNLDSVHPEPLKKLRHNLNQWEFLNNNMDSNLQVATIQKNVDRSAWAETYDKEFKKLISKARANRAKERQRKEEHDEEEEEVKMDSDLVSQVNAESSVAEIDTDKTQLQADDMAN